MSELDWLATTALEPDEVPEVPDLVGWCPECQTYYRRRRPEEGHYHAPPEEAPASPRADYVAAVMRSAAKARRRGGRRRPAIVRAVPRPLPDAPAQQPIAFTIGPRVRYEVVVTRGPLTCRGHDGPVGGLCCYDDRRIILSGAVPVDLRVHVLLHELRHAWLHHWGRVDPSEVEADCQSAATFAEEMMLQIYALGGPAAIEAMAPTWVSVLPGERIVKRASAWTVEALHSPVDRRAVPPAPASVDRRTHERKISP